MNTVVHSNKQASQQLTFFSLLGVLSLLFVIEGVDLLLGGSLDKLGIRPREVFGLVGIPASPFLHGGFGHLMSNSIPFLVLGYIVLKAEKLRFLAVSAAIAVMGGLGTWLIGREGTVHIGLSGVIYGYFGYVMMRGFTEGRLKWILVGLFTTLFFGGMIFGVIPTGDTPMSWEGHLCGMLAGGWIGRTRGRGLTRKGLG